MIQYGFQNHYLSNSLMISSFGNPLSNNSGIILRRVKPYEFILISLCLFSTGIIVLIL